jgi:hypothetical protein
MKISEAAISTTTRVVLLVGVILGFAGASKAQTIGPFGFEKGMTRDRVLKLVGKAAVEGGLYDEVLIVTTAPKPNPAFGSYHLYFSPKEGLLKVAAIGKPVKTESDAAQLTVAFNDVVTWVTQRYGPADTDTISTSGDMRSLLEKNRFQVKYWVDKQFPNHVVSIAVESQALGINSGDVTCSFEFEGYAKYVYTKRKQIKNY